MSNCVPLSAAVPALRWTKFQKSFSQQSPLEGSTSLQKEQSLFLVAREGIINPLPILLYLI